MFNFVHVRIFTQKLLFFVTSLPTFSREQGSARSQVLTRLGSFTIGVDMELPAAPAAAPAAPAAQASKKKAAAAAAPLPAAAPRPEIIYPLSSKDRTEEGRRWYLRDEPWGRDPVSSELFVHLIKGASFFNGMRFVPFFA